MFIFRAFYRLFRGIAFMFTGTLDGFTDKVNQNPDARQGTYNDIISKKRDSINRYMEAVATMMGQREQKAGMLKAATRAICDLEKQKAGAAGKAKEVVAQLQSQGKTKEEIEKDAEYIRCKAFFNNFSTTLEEKKALSNEYEEAIKGYDDRIGNHKLKLTALKKELEGLHAEKAEDLATMIGAAQETKLNKILAGVANDTSDAELQKLREQRRTAEAQAKISSELAGTDTKVVEAEFESFASTHESNAEFDSLVGLGVPADVMINNMQAELANMDKKPVASEA